VVLSYLRSSRVVVCALLVAAAPVAQDAAESAWSRFRGPNGAGIAAGGRYEAEIGPEQRVIWKRAFPPGHSSPVFSAERVFLTAVEDDRLWTYALDRETGATVWRREAPRPRRTTFHGKNGPAAASAAVDEDTVVVFFDEYGMLAYDHDGEERWRMPLGPFFNIYGMGASPVLVEGVAVLACDDGKDSYVLGADKRTGEELYRVARPDAVSGHCTPVVYRPDGKPVQFLLPGSFVLDAYEVRTGERVWWVRGLPCEMKSVPALRGDTLWIHGYGSPMNDRGKQLELPGFADALAKMDADGDDALSRDELEERRVRSWFPFLDLDRSGGLDAGEWRLCRASFASVNAAMAIRCGGEGDRTEDAVLWRYYRSIPQLPSPLVLGDVYYLASDQGGLVTTISASTGERIAKARVGDAGDAYFTSPVAGDGKVYLLGESGVLTVLRAGGLEELHRADFGEPCFATPALVDDSVWIRTEGHLYRLGAQR
jgi:hypothetical protein